MPFDNGALNDGLVNAMAPTIEPPPVKARKIASAYQRFLLEVLGPVGAPPLFTGSEVGAFVSAYLPPMSSHGGSVQTVAGAFAGGCAAFWGPVTFPFPPYVGKPAVNPGPLQAAIVSILLNPSGVHPSVALSIAAAISSWTQALVVTYVGVPPPVPPPGVMI